MYGRHFHDNYDEYRRFRLETRTRFLRYFTAEMDVNMVSDNRYRDPPDNLLQWGYDDFDTAIIDCDLLKAFHTGMFDELSIAYGKMKMPISEEQRQSSKAIYTIERSMLSSKLAGEESRPTGILLDASKGDWRGRLGCFSGEDDADFLAAWNDGFTQFYTLHSTIAPPTGPAPTTPSATSPPSRSAPPTKRSAGACRPRWSMATMATATLPTAPKTVRTGRAISTALASCLGIG
jgi:hypothetical protein